MVHMCRLLAQWLRQPLRDRSAIVERHDVVQVILQDAEMRQMLRDEHLRRIPDLQALAKKLGRKKAGLHDCYRCSRSHIGYLHLCHMGLMHSTALSIEICGSCLNASSTSN